MPADDRDRDRCGCTGCKAEKATTSAGVVEYVSTQADDGDAKFKTVGPTRVRSKVGREGPRSADERTALLPTTANRVTSSSPPRLLARTRTHLSGRLSSQSLLLLLLSTSFPTGFLDASTYTDFRMFASNQTGNVIVLTVAVAQGWNSRSLLSAVSVGGFSCAGLVSGRWAHWRGGCPRRRSWVLGSCALQTLLCGIGLALLHAGLLPKDHWVLLVLLSFASGLQVSIARTSSIGEIPTAMLTSPIIDLVTDPNLFLPLSIHAWLPNLLTTAHTTRPPPDPRTIGRNRRLVYISILASGSTIGAAITKRWDTKVVLSLVVLAKALIAAFVAIAPGDGDQGRWAAAFRVSNQGDDLSDVGIAEENGHEGDSDSLDEANGDHGALQVTVETDRARSRP